MPEFQTTRSDVNINHQQASGRRRNGCVTLLINLAAMALIASVLGWIALAWLDVWTGHGKTEIVPDVKGMQYDRAVDRLGENGLVVELSDSVYDAKALPGAVVDQNPKQGAKVKPGRTIYLVINAFSPRMVTVPALTEISARQARSILEGLGVRQIVERKVVSEYKDLVIGASYRNHRLTAGARIPVNAVVVLEVGEGWPELNDSLPMDDKNLNTSTDEPLGLD